MTIKDWIETIALIIFGIAIVITALGGYVHFKSQKIELYWQHLVEWSKGYVHIANQMENLSGDEKMKYVVDSTADTLASHGYKIDPLVKKVIEGYAQREYDSFNGTKVNHTTSAGLAKDVNENQVLKPTGDDNND